MRGKIKVSVIIPVYNAEDYLRECLDSIAGQTLRDIEIICVDDGSTDNSPAILREYASGDARIRIATQKNMYAGVARNKGIELAEGAYLAFADADDFMDEGYLEALYKRSVETDADICLCGCDKYNMKTGKHEVWTTVFTNMLPGRAVFSNRDLGDEVLNCVVPAPHGKMFSRRFVTEKGLRFQEIRHSNDVYFSQMSMALAERITLADKALYHYRTGLEHNLQSIKKQPDSELCEIRALYKIRDELAARGMFKGRYRRSWLNLLFTSFMWCLDQSFDNDEKLMQFYEIYRAGRIEDWRRVKYQLKPEILCRLGVVLRDRTEDVGAAALRRRVKAAERLSSSGKNKIRLCISAVGIGAPFYCAKYVCGRLVKYLKNIG